eukprot:gb/GECG01013563.1/.p1 GENE.gb/GECG01013563.1/~~gb/GECG01013563.1/.p1  ORF type:complete len:130 (+),score=17.93 gb/GECG01013563.1/:1-390(+)
MSCRMGGTPDQRRLHMAVRGGPTVRLDFGVEGFEQYMQEYRSRKAKRLVHFDEENDLCLVEWKGNLSSEDFTWHAADDLRLDFGVVGFEKHMQDFRSRATTPGTGETDEATAEDEGLVANSEPTPEERG